MRRNHKLSPPVVYRSACFRLIVIISTLVAGFHGDSRGQPPAESDASFFRQLARRVEPTLVGDATRLPQYVQFYRHELANDPRLFAFRVSATRQDDGVQLKGYVEFEEHRRGVAGLLRALGFASIDNQIELLPDADLPQPIGFIKSPRSFGYNRPNGDGGIETECLIWEPLFLLRRVSNDYLVHSGEGYLSYVAACDVQPISPAALAELSSGSWVTLTADVTETRLGTLPLGARLPVVGWGQDSCLVRLPDGSALEIARDPCSLVADPQPLVARIIDAGRYFLGTPYLWGGRSTGGIDCSGLVQVAYGTIGVSLPRDSNQQIYAGRLTGTRWCRNGMQPGDTMYFLGPRGRIRHTGIYLGDDRYLHATTPVVSMNSLNPEHDDYDARRAAAFAFAKRPLDRHLVTKAQPTVEP